MITIKAENFGFMSEEDFQKAKEARLKNLSHESKDLIEQAYEAGFNDCANLLGKKALSIGHEEGDRVRKYYEKSLKEVMNILNDLL